MFKQYGSKGLLALGLLVGLVPAAKAFDTGPHQDLTREVLAEIGFNQDANETVQLENWLTDYYTNQPLLKKVLPSIHVSLDKLHFDNLTTTSQVDHYWQRFTVNSKIAFQEAARNKDSFRILVLLGMSLHAVQDFYTHSNWVETHPAPPGSDYATVTWFDTKNRNSVRTGSYPALSNPPGANDHGNYTHGLNHDSQSRPEFHRAYTFAYAASRQWVSQVRAWVTEIDANEWQAAQHQSLSSSDRSQLKAGLEAAYRISEWVAADGNDGHWKGKGSGSGPEFYAAGAAWMTTPCEKFTRPFFTPVPSEDYIKKHNCVWALTAANADGRQELGVDAPATVAVPKVAHIPIKKQMIVVRATEIKELPVGLFDTKIDSLGTADFYAKITIDGMTLIENTYQNKERVVDPWDTFKFVDDSKERVDIHIEVWDEDMPFKISDDHCDINPGDKVDLDMTLNTRSQELSGDVRGIFDNHDKPWGEGGKGKDPAFLKAYCRSRKLADLAPDNDGQEPVSVAKASVFPGIFSLLALGLVGGVVAERR
ncbi:C2 domain-containing protein [Armatimonas sp.]|uniref:C2 domain-containing protein n=1 Tax=Armatimonas sp. TaxID=1872638 RepID=UPI003750EA91